MEPPNEQEMHRLIKDFVDTNPNHPLMMVLNKAGLTMQVRKSKETHKQQLVKAVQSVVNLYLDSYSDETKGDIVGEMLFNHQVLQTSSVNHMAVKIGRSMNSFIFTTVNILKCIDLQRSLNDRGVNELVSIQTHLHGQFEVLPMIVRLIEDEDRLLNHSRHSSMMVTLGAVSTHHKRQSYDCLP
jgi:hypothetical protein